MRPARTSPASRARNPLRRFSIQRPFRRQTRPGALPGSIVPPPDAPAPVVELIWYGPEAFRRQRVEDLERLPVPEGEPGVVWLNIDGLGDPRIIEQVGRLFHLHPLSLEDVVHAHQRAKTEIYDDYLFLVARMMSTQERLESEQISIFLGKAFVVTFQERPGDCLEPLRQRLEKGHGRIRKAGADYLAYSILDSVIDGYFPVVEQFGERLDRLDLEITGAKRDHILAKLHQLRGELLLVRRQIWPHREAVNGLLRNEAELLSGETLVYLRDTYDHTAQLMDVVEVYREICTDLRDLYLSLLSHRSNEIMKVLTMIATIFIPLSFITGIYGMNFQYMPELHWRAGYPIVLGFMGAVAAGLVAFIWRKGWFRS